MKTEPTQPFTIGFEVHEHRQFLIQQRVDGHTRIDVRVDAENLWLNQKQLIELFGKAKGTISEHTKHIFEDGEWTPEATVRLFRTVQLDKFRVADV